VFDIEICEPRNVILVRFRGEVSATDFAALDGLGQKMRAGPRADCIFDMSGVDKVALSTEFVAQRGDLPQAFRDRERLYVVPQDDLKLLVKLYATYQASRGWRPPLILDRIEEAFSRLGVSSADFETLPLADSES
jgi:hypothetical protein